MVDANKVKKGMKIAKSFPAAQFDEFYYLRKSSWANAVINDLNRSLLDETYVRKFTDEDIVSADLIVSELIELNNKIEIMKNEI